tara:strand:- start:5089 stop:5289 length:201 start_codon:yes stop_codon:yes gene_type:complete
MYYGMIVYQDDEPSDLELFDDLETAIEYFQESVDMRLDGALGDVYRIAYGRIKDGKRIPINSIKFN